MKTAFAALLLVTGCSLYSNQNSGDDVCNGIALPASPQLRDPQTGQCETFNYGGGGGSGCYADGGAPADAGIYNPTTGEPAIPNWASCYSSCEGLDESDCLVASGCQAAYLDPSGVESNIELPAQFWGCWAVAPTGPIEGGGCAGLDAVTCSEHDDCTVYYSEPALGGDLGSGVVDTNFERCAPNPGSDTCADVDCGSGSTCVDNCADPVPGTGGPLSCAPQCVTNLDPGSCTGTVTCNIAGPSCPTGTVAGILDGCYSGYCIPQAQCGPSDPGTCTAGSGAMCALAAPSCPTNTTPGISDGCWSGYCIPNADCPQVACGDLMSESTCEARSDCDPVYTGTGCTCQDGACTCTGEAFSYCETLGGGSGSGWGSGSGSSTGSGSGSGSSTGSGYVNPGGPEL